MHLRIRPALAVIILTGVVIVTMAVSLSLLLWNLHDRDLGHARGETVSLSHVLAEQTTRSLQNVDLAMLNMRAALAGYLTSGEPMTRYGVHRLLHDRLSGMPQIKHIFITDAAGRVLSTSRVYPAEGVLVNDRDYFKAQRDDDRHGLYIGTPTHNRMDGQWTLYLSRRLNGRHGEFAGVIAVALNLSQIEELYDSIAFDGIEPITLHLADGTLIASSPHDEEAVGKRVQAAEDWFRGADEATRIDTDAHGAKWIKTYHRVSQFPLIVGVGISESNALESWHEKSWLLVVGTLSVMALIVLAAWSLVHELRKEEVLARELLASGERLRETMRTAMDAIIIADAGQRIILFNPAAEGMFGRSVAEALGMRLEELLPERYRTGRHGLIESRGERQEGIGVEAVGLRADGGEFPIEASVSQVEANGEMLYTVILRDVTERRRADQQLLTTNRQLRELSATLQDVREKERARIARELHDELGQKLTGLKMELSWLGNQLAGAREDLAAKVDGMKQQADMTIKAVRRISTDLRPALLDDLGLCPAIEWLARDFSGRTGIAVELDLAAEDCDYGDEMATALFRITQECLTNVARHAEAKRVGISLRLEEGVLTLVVKDDGKGMDASATAKTGGYGLIGIRERAIMLGAKATFLSRPGAGTTVTVAIPMAGRTSAELPA
ncbi:MAG: PAS domain S-box protein [Ignavibacteria bacterium]